MKKLAAISVVVTLTLALGLVPVSSVGANPIPSGPFGYSVRSDVDSHLYRIDLSSGATTDLGLVGLSDTQGAEFVGGTLYGIGGTVMEFWDITTPPGSKVGDTGSRNGIDAGLAYDSTSGNMYNIQRSSTTTWLYEIDIATGLATPIGSSTVAQPDGLAIDSNGVAYALDGINNDALYTVDLSSGALILVGSLGVDLLNEVGLSFDPASGTLYCLTDGGEIYTINKSTGAATKVTDTLSGFESLAIGYRFTFTKEITGEVEAGDMDGWLEPGEDWWWTITATLTNISGETIEVEKFHDRLGGDLEWHVIGWSAAMGSLDWYTRGKTEKVFLNWYDGFTLADGEAVHFEIIVSPDVNTGTGNGKKDGHQEYTSIGEHCLNSGAWFGGYIGDTYIEGSSNPVCVMVYEAD